VKVEDERITERLPLPIILTQPNPTL